MKYYDAIIIGSGGGAKLRPAAELGKQVAIIERERLGGTCLNKGCIPSKMLLYPAELLTHFKEDAKRLHINVQGDAFIDFQTLSREVNQKVKENSDAIEPMYNSNPNIDYYHQEAIFVEDKVIKVADELITAHRIYIATGSSPHIPNIKGLNETPFFTSKEALRNDILPEKLVVIGGGYIATELGHFYGASGSEVHFIVRGEILKNEDRDIREEFSRNFSQRYNIHKATTPTEVNYKDGTFFINIVDGHGHESIIEADALLVATGVIPNSQSLRLENTHIKVDKKGYIKVDEYLETNVKGVYALGDVVGNYLFRHSVNFEGEYLLGQHFLGDVHGPIEYPAMPHAVFSYPQVAGVGITEDELLLDSKRPCIDYEVAVHKYSDCAMGMASKPEVGMVKLIADKYNGRLIGAHVVGEKASDIIHMLIVYVTQRKKVSKILKEMIFIHPALSEVIRNALRKLNKQLKNKK